VGWADLAKQEETQLKNNRTPLISAPDQGFRQAASFVRLAGYLRQCVHSSVWDGVPGSERTAEGAERAVDKDPASKREGNLVT
jgi:hypothetical protein